MNGASIRVQITVRVDAQRAFRAFTEDIDQWYRRPPQTRRTDERPPVVAFEPRVGGALYEGSDASGDRRELAQVTAWEPPGRLAFVDRRGSEVEIRFEPVPGGTHVVLEHRGLDRLPPGEGPMLATVPGWSRLLDQFEAHMRARNEP
jgi:uncharacterized protein YndB with AHSA1/START domain